MSETFADFRIVPTIRLMILLGKMSALSCPQSASWLQVMIFTQLIEMSHLGPSPINYYCARKDKGQIRAQIYSHP